MRKFIHISAMLLITIYTIIDIAIFQSSAADCNTGLSTYSRCVNSAFISRFSYLLIFGIPLTLIAYITKSRSK